MDWLPSLDMGTHRARHLGRIFQQKRQDASQRRSAVPDALCWTEGRNTVSSFHSTYHCSLQHFTPRNNSHIVLRKSVHFFFCCFKASIFAHPLVQCCNRVVKAPSNTNVASWQHKQELHWLVLEQVAQVSLPYPFPVLPTVGHS